MHAFFVVVSTAAILPLLLFSFLSVHGILSLHTPSSFFCFLGMESKECGEMRGFCERTRAARVLSVLDDGESVHDHVGDEGKDDGKEVDGLASGNRLHLLRCGFFDDRLEHQRVRRLVGMNHR